MITTLQMAHARNIIHSIGSSFQLQSHNFSFPVKTFILKGEFSFLNHTNCIYYKDQPVVINCNKADPSISYIDNTHIIWDAESLPVIKKYEECNEKISLGPELFCIISTQWGQSNIYHLFFDALAKISVLNNYYDLSSIHFLVPEFVNSFRHLFDLFNLRYSLYSRNIIYSGNFLIPSMPSPFGHPSFDVCNLFSKLPEILKFDVLDVGASKYIYVARRTKRAISNEDELFSFLCTKFPFKKIYLEDLTIKDQFATMRNAEFIVAPHGAGLTWQVFQRKGVLLEIHSPNYVSLSYQTIALNNINIRYIPFYCDDSKQYAFSNSNSNDNYFLDIDRFVEVFQNI